MAEAFRGEFYQKVDAKARVSIPAPFRRVLEAGDVGAASGRPRVVMVYGGRAGQAYVECYSVAQMAVMEDKIRKLAPGTPQRKVLERNYITLSQTVEIDDDGRLVLPAKVRERIGLNDAAEACFAGALDTFQIWLRETYDAEMAAQEEIDLDLPDGADLLSLLPHDGA